MPRGFPAGQRPRLKPHQIAAMVEGARRYRASRPPEVRFWLKVDKSAGEDSCWLWKGEYDRHPTHPYGRFTLKWAPNGSGQQVRTMAHRAAWMFTNGEIPEGMQIDHICKNTLCVNPKHLRVVTPVENYVTYSDSPLAINARKDRCSKGHLLTPENTALKSRGPLVQPNGMKVGKTKVRICLTCIPSEWRYAMVPRDPPPNARLTPEEREKYRKPLAGSTD